MVIYKYIYIYIYIYRYSRNNNATAPQSHELASFMYLALVARLGKCALQRYQLLSWFASTASCWNTHVVRCSNHSVHTARIAEVFRGKKQPVSTAAPWASDAKGGKMGGSPPCPPLGEGNWARAGSPLGAHDVAACTTELVNFKSKAGEPRPRTSHGLGPWWSQPRAAPGCRQTVKQASTPSPILGILHSQASRSASPDFLTGRGHPFVRGSVPFELNMSMHALLAARSRTLGVMPRLVPKSLSSRATVIYFAVRAPARP